MTVIFTDQEAAAAMAVLKAFKNTVAARTDLRAQVSDKELAEVIGAMRAIARGKIAQMMKDESEQSISA